MPKLGLIGFPLAHSFSVGYFTKFFSEKGLEDWSYHNFPIQELNQDTFQRLWAENADLVGLNVTIPHKQRVLPLLNFLSPMAQRIGAVNTIVKTPDGKFKGLNTDYHGFRDSLKLLLGDALREPATIQKPLKAMVFGNGGAAKAAKEVLQNMFIPYLLVTRKAGEGDITFGSLNPEIASAYRIWINTTPVGTFPAVDDKLPLPYEVLKEDCFLFDMVYNPAETAFLRAGALQGAKCMNGLPMLERQAMEAWHHFSKRS